MNDFAGHRMLARPFCPKGAALIHSETVLLVDHDVRKVVENHGIFEERVSADEEDRFALFEACKKCRAFGRRGFARQSRDVEAASKNFHSVAIVLIGQNFSRCHEHGLSTFGQNATRTEKRDGRFTGADVALDEAVHWMGLREVREDLVDRFLLVAREFERQKFFERKHPVSAAVGAEGRGAFFFHSYAFAKDEVFEFEKLFVD